MLLEGSNASTVLTWVRPDLDKHLNAVLWDGTSWGGPTELGTNTGEVGNQPFVFLWP